MSRPPLSLLASAAAVLSAALACGCGFGPGPSTKGTATLDVTSDYGAKPMADATVSDPTESETVLRFLDRETQITTRYGGGFVQSINGLSGAVSGGRSSDWFFYVNGIESPVGAADVNVKAGDRIWWDYRDWTDAMGVPAVVGSYPEPLLQASTAKSDRKPVSVRCGPGTARGSACGDAIDQLNESGVNAIKAPLGSPDSAGFDVLVGTYDELAGQPQMKLLQQGPAASGVFAEFESGGKRLDGLGVNASEQLRLGAGGGIVASVREGEDQPSWIVSGTDESGVEAAAKLLDPGTLKDHYAVLTDRSRPIPVPVDSGAEVGQ